MRPVPKAFLLALVILCTSGTAHAQVGPYVGATASFVGSRHLGVDRALFSPQIVIGWLRSARLLSLEANVYGTYRREGPGPSCPHCIAYEYHEYLVGFRFAATLRRALLPLTFGGGLARAVAVGRATSATLNAPATNDQRVSGTYATFGVGLLYAVGGRFLVKPGAYAEVWLGREQIPARVGVGVGVGYLF